MDRFVTRNEKVLIGEKDALTSIQPFRAFLRKRSYIWGSNPSAAAFSSLMRITQRLKYMRSCSGSVTEWFRTLECIRANWDGAIRRRGHDTASKFEIEQEGKATLNHCLEGLYSTLNDETPQYLHQTTPRLPFNL